jgi:methyl-accepting chemotaxis protein
MSTGFVLVLLREIRESILKLREEFNTRLDQTNERLDQTSASLGRVEHDLHELRKYMRQMALNQAKHEQAHSQPVERLDSDANELKEQLQRLKKGV